MRQTIPRLFTVFLLTVSVFAQTVTTEKTLTGFSAENSVKQKQLEAKFDSFLKAENLRAWMKRLAARPHYVGLPCGKENAEFIAA